MSKAENHGWKTKERAWVTKAGSVRGSNQIYIALIYAESYTGAIDPRKRNGF